MKQLFLYAIVISIFASCSSSGGDDSQPESASFDVTAISVTNINNGVPAKGDEIIIEFTIENTGEAAGTAILKPKLTSSRFSDYKNVNLPTLEKQIAAGETTSLSYNLGPFFQDEENEKRYALASGEYFFESITINDTQTDTNYSGRVFNIEESNALLVPVIYSAQYLSKLNYSGSMQSFLTTAFTRKVELFKNETYTDYEGGFDEMMGVKHIFYPILTSNVSDYDIDEGLCEKATALGGDMLGLAGRWQGPVGTQSANHGFDYLMSITSDSFGGVACGWINVQVSGVFDFDLSVDRAQIVLIHETSHLFGAPHCDPLQSYVMCAGEKHRKYIDQGIYVYHIDSKNQMSNQWD